MALSLNSSAATQALTDHIANMAVRLAAICGLNRDQRTHNRMSVDLRAKCSSKDCGTFSASICDISAGGARVRSKERPALQRRVRCQIENVGSVTGRVIRHESGGFAVRFEGINPLRERVLEKLIWQANQDALGISSGQRKAPAIGMDRARVYVGSTVIPCTILDMSLRGVALAMNDRPAIGSEIRVGRLKGEVSRHHALGIDVIFDEPETEVEAAAQAA